MEVLVIVECKCCDYLLMLKYFFILQVVTNLKQLLEEQQKKVEEVAVLNSYLSAIEA